MVQGLRRSSEVDLSFEFAAKAYSSQFIAFGGIMGVDV